MDLKRMEQIKRRVIKLIIRNIKEVKDLKQVKWDYIEISYNENELKYFIDYVLYYALINIDFPKNNYEIWQDFQEYLNYYNIKLVKYYHLYILLR